MKQNYEDADNFSESAGLSESSEISKAHAENAQLRELNLQLSTELKNLQSQFNDAVGVFTKMDEVNKENADLKQKILKLNRENDDLQQRFKIMLASNNERKNDANLNQTATDREHQDQIYELNSQIYELQNKLKLEADRYATKLKNNEELLYQTQTENSIIRNQLNKIFSLSHNFFHLKFNSVQDLIEFMMHPAPIPEPSEPTLTRTEDNTSNDKKKLKSIKEKLEKEKVRRKQLELEVIQLRQGADLAESRQAGEKTDIEEMKRKYVNEIRRLKSEHQREIVNLTKQYTEPKKQYTVGTQTEVINEPQIPTEQLLKESKLKSQLKETQLSLTQLQTQTNSFQAQLNDTEKMRDKLTRKAKEYQGKADNLQKDLKEAQKMISFLNSQIEQLKEEKKELENLILQTKLDNDERQNKYEISSTETANLKKSVEYFEELTNSQCNEIKKLTQDRDQLILLVHSQNQCISNSESIIAKLQKTVKDTKPTIMKRALIDQNNLDYNNDPKQWDYGTLPEELQEILRDFACNEGMELNQRIKHIFSVVSKWVDKINFDHDAETKELKDKLKTSNDTIANFATSILRVIEKDSLDLKEIIAAVSDLYNQKIALEQRINEIEATPRHYSEHDYEELTQTIESLRQQIKDVKAKEKKKKNELRDCKATFVECQKKSQEQVDTLKTANDRAHETINDLQAQLNDLHNQHKTLLDDISYQQRQENKSYYDENDITNLRNEYSSMIQDQKTAHKKKDAVISSLRKKNKELESSLKQWEEISKKMNDDSRKMKQQMGDNQKELNDKDDTIAQLNSIIAQKDTEIQQVENHYQEMIEQLRDKSSQTEVIVQAMQNEFEANEKKMKEMNQQIVQLNFKLQKADLQLQAQVNSAEREKKLSEAQTRTQIMAIQTKYSVEAEEEKSKWENEKRALFGYLAQQFSTYFDPLQTLNEESFKQTITKIKNELERRDKQELVIRKLLKAKGNQPTEDALADLILSQHPQLNTNSSKKLSALRY